MPVDQYINTGHSAGEECSSTGGGRHLTFEESVLVHPKHADGMVDKGDPVRVGNTVGVAFNSAAAEADLISIDTEGIWWLNVLGIVSDTSDDGIAEELAPGSPIYIQKVPGSDVYILSGESDPQHFQPFGYALSTVTAHLTVPTLIAVKVHADRETLLRLDIGAYGDDLLLEGDGALRHQTWSKGFFGPATALLAGEQIHVVNHRIESLFDEDVGTLNCHEFKVIHSKAGQLAGMFPLKINIDNRTGAGGAVMAAGIEILAEGGGTAHDALCGVRFIQHGTDGQVMAPFRFDTNTSFGLKAITTAPSDGGGTMYQFPIDVAGVIVGYVAVYDTTGS